MKARATIIFVRLFALAGMAVLLSACAFNGVYRSRFSSCNVSFQNDCAVYSLQRHQSPDPYLLGFVEIDDQGQIRDRRQMHALLDTLYRDAADASLLMTVLVHGWHHNADPRDGNIDSFKDNLAKLSRIEQGLSQIEGRPARKIVGVYIGWRGESIDVPPFNYLTFWDRKNTAQDVGYLGISELLVKLEEIANVKNSMQPPVKSRLAIIGHSFGGAVVYSAVSQILAARFVNSRPGQNATADAEGFGDLVVLLNPAFEALRFAPFYDMAQSRCSYFPSQLPRLAILTSEADNATGILFPLGRFFSTVFETHQTLTRQECGRNLELDEGEADRTAVGHYRTLISHRLEPAPAEKTVSLRTYESIDRVWQEQNSGASLHFGSILLTHLKKTHPLNPYLNIRVDPAIISDHNDVFNEKVMEFIRLLIMLSTSDKAEKAP
jgi:hypothetical protein